VLRHLRSTAIAMACTFCGSAAADVLLTFDGVVEGTIVSTLHRGVTLRGIGEGGPFDVIAVSPCGNAASSPNVISFLDVASCPESNGLDGWFEAEFELDQPWVSIDILALGSGSVGYLKVYGGPTESDFLDQKASSAGPAWVGVPQTLRIDRQTGQRQITRMIFGGLNFDANKSGFDNLGFALRPVASSTRSFAAVKALY
jgi:hypothetical protein